MGAKAARKDEGGVHWTQSSRRNFKFPDRFMSKTNQIPKLTLASSSPYRKELLARLGLPFAVQAPDIDESPNPGESGRALVIRLALEKAMAVATQLPEGLIIGSDQVAVNAGQIIGKPRDRDDAIAQLTQASGREICLYTGVALINAACGRTQSDVVIYRVRYRTLNPRQIVHYLDLEQPYGCCGSLRSEGLGIALLDSIRGDDPSALIGLPLIRLIGMLEAEGVELIPGLGSV